jgi:hypothetical protein
VKRGGSLSFLTIFTFVIPELLDLLVFSASPANRGKGYWKFNSQLLRDSNYIDIVKTCIRDTLSEYYSGGNIDDFLHVELLCNEDFCF